MPPLTHYEVYAFEERGWTLQKRFISTERDKAIEEAKSLETFLNMPTKVIREYHNPQTGMSDEHVVYISPRVKEMREQAHRARTGSALPMGYRPNARMPEGLENYSNYSYTESELADKRYAKSVGDLLGRVLLVLAASLILAAMGTSLIPAVLNLLRFGGRVGLGNMGDILFGIFLFLFVVSTTLIGRKLIPFAGVLVKPPTPKVRKESKYTPATADEEDAKPADSEVTEKKGEDREADFDPVALMDEHKSLKQSPKPKPDPKDGQGEAERQAKTKAEAEEQARKARKEAEEARAETIAREETTANDPEGDEDEGIPDRDLARTAAMTFLGGTVAALKTISIQLDVFTRFGVNLYLAGACEALAGRLRLPETVQHGLLREMLEVMGTRPALGLMFIDKMEEYLIEPRYMLMVQAGREAMWMQLANGGDPFRPLPQIMADWTTPQAKKPTTSTIAIVFTDMVGSTDVNSKVGDLMAREVTRVHNTIVRSALSRFEGREVKHTGDGIMATFQVISQAAEAAVDIQRAVDSHNARRPDLSIELRVGINAGEPVVEENDYYGIAVTLAARICAQASGGTILCSGVVRDLSQGKDLRFRDRGQAKLKGISDPQRLFEIVWDPNAPTTNRDDSSEVATLPGKDAIEPLDPAAGMERPHDPNGKPQGVPIGKAENKPD
ncbi:MAG: adenylate/guanylate cyclase domain-containing protein [Rhodospirillum sp.]|nr:adenylate/guanylate cyclase domain-containing protein [Rhodospirillum sp.]MCF8491127.1 adenylate/guanylate cyclase domain-containing protein [Rhodospirillum sp.]MCF8501659.1 adenylate/guanylate cyclase domain-containing protein [Rhodospirillum sp.]